MVEHLYGNITTLSRVFQRWINCYAKKKSVSCDKIVNLALSLYCPDENRKRSHAKQKVITTKVDTYFENHIFTKAHLRYTYGN